MSPRTCRPYQAYQKSRWYMGWDCEESPNKNAVLIMFTLQFPIRYSPSISPFPISQAIPPSTIIIATVSIYIFLWIVYSFHNKNSSIRQPQPKAVAHLRFGGPSWSNQVLEIQSREYTKKGPPEVTLFLIYALQDSNLRPTDSSLCRFLDSFDYPFTLFRRT